MIIFDDDGVGYDVIPRKVIKDIKSEIAERIDSVKNISLTTKVRFERATALGEEIAYRQCLVVIDKYIREEGKK